MRNQGADDPTGKRAGSPSTAIAAQNRVSRMRQEQIMSKDGKSHQQAHLIEKRKLIKERRLLQQKRAVVASVDPPSQNPAQQLDKMVDTPRRTKLISKPAVSPTPLLDSAQSPLRRMHHEPEKTAPSTPSTPGKNGVSRLSKMQRMQKMKGINDHVKKGMSPKVCASTLSPPTMTSPPATENVPASKVSSLQRRQRQTSIRQNRIKRTSVIIESQPNSTPVNHTKTDDRTRTPPAMNSSVPHLPIASPTSDTDGLSDMNYTYGPTTDHSVDPTTDDEATLTSVRRIMTKEVNEPARDPYHHYHHLQAQSKQRDDPSFLAKWTNGNRPAQPEFPGVSNSGYDGFRGSSRPTATMGRTKRSSRKKWSAMDENAMLANTPGVFRTASSSDYDTDGDVSKTSRHSNVLDGPSQSQATDVNEFFSTSRYTQGNRRMDDDDRTFDYGDRDDDSNGSTSFMARQKREADSRRGVPSHEAPEALKAGPSALINKDDVEHYTKSLGTPAMRIGAGVVGVVTIGCFVLGPAGLLAGAAAVGVGIGIMQIPDEERNRLQDKVQKTVGRVHDKAVDATEKLSNSCASTYEESGIAEHLPQCLSLSGMESDGLRDHEPARYEKKVTGNKSDEPVVVSRNGQKASVASPPTLEPGSRSEMANNSERPRNKKVACLRHVRILPASQIHGLDPAIQPKAWLDVVASANTSVEEKNEALEEILILAKDKRRARILLDEGVLDALLWTLDRYHEKTIAKERGWANRDISPGEKRAAKLAATCCLTLGKTHCAAIHTEGDLQLMSLYERGTVPEERQVAQMLHEVAHHVRIIKGSDPTIIEPSKEVFALRQLSLQQAEELALSIKAIVDGHQFGNI